MNAGADVHFAKDCPIATPVLNKAYGPMREDIIKSVSYVIVNAAMLIVSHRNIYSYKKGVSLVLRDSIDVSAVNSERTTPLAVTETKDNTSASCERQVCVSDHRAIVRERVGHMHFEYPGGSFFQNNNSVLVPLTDYVRDAIFLSTPAATPSERPTHLVDAYCGAGLFAITLSPHFDTIAGIELSLDSIKFATRNAQLNDVPEGKCTFRAGDAADIFAAVSEFPPDHTALIIDPPRKGCDENFINQLLTFRANTVVYVSCNVHTQARDVGMILKRSEHEANRNGVKKYVLESLRGFDLFPQTAHVESVAVLRLHQPSD
jgi:tRNA (uracil-5-)-methyltransferase